ncbi:hypothetical protein M2321_000506 [Rhodoblastus acidophilus]|jgi:porin|uniref:hypothetical protein n=1 Tax=Rhodoblastus acidophilus TaxID=1074 RepID=UPI0018B05F36|nr:hypothetical protein [Rhodoblastus acidophilus]MCW2272942.1 hypothetical protein [Rhodoblastus acidophilus]
MARARLNLTKQKIRLSWLALIAAAPALAAEDAKPVEPAADALPSLLNSIPGSAPITDAKKYL